MRPLASLPFAPPAPPSPPVSCARFDDLIKLVLALAPDELNEWIASMDGEDESPTGRVQDSSVDSGGSGTPVPVVPEAPTVAGSSLVSDSPSTTLGSFKEYSVDATTTAGPNGGSRIGSQRRRSDHKDQLDTAYEEIRNLRFQCSMAQRRLRRYEVAAALRVSIDDYSMEDGHVAFVVNVTSTVDASFQRTMRRRYREFVALHAELQSALPLPPKSFFWKTSEGFLRHRAAGLELFLQEALRRYNVCHVHSLAAFIEAADELAVSDAYQSGRKSSPAVGAAPWFDQHQTRRIPSTGSAPEWYR